MRYDFENPETFLIVADKVSDIVEANVYDNEKTVSTLTDTVYSKLQLFDAK